MDTNKHGFSRPLAKEVYETVTGAFEVLNKLGNGLLEKPDKNAMVVEFKLRKIPFSQQQNFPAAHKSVKVDENGNELFFNKF